MREGRKKQQDARRKKEAGKEKRGGRAEEIVKGRAVHGGRSSCQLFTRVMCEQQRREHVTEEGCRVAKMVVARCFPDFQHARIDSTLETMCPKGPQMSSKIKPKYIQNITFYQSEQCVSHIVNTMLFLTSASLKRD